MFRAHRFFVFGRVVSSSSFGRIDTDVGFLTKSTYWETTIMSKSARRSPNNPSGPGSGGPRTPAGKRRSAQNASKHKIFAGRILPEEQKEAMKLFAQFQEDLQPECSLENEIISDLVLNRLQARRIDKHFVYEVRKAGVPAVLADLGQLDARYRANYIHSAVRLVASTPEDAVRGAIHPGHCVWALEVLKANIVSHGAQPQGDLTVLNGIYGTEMTATAIEIVRLYRLLERAQAQGAAASEAASLQAEILVKLDHEIGLQQHRWQLEHARDQFEIGTDRAPFLTDADLTRLERYRSGNMRQFVRLLEAFQRIRRLRNPESDE
jgi:hypothetical protein